MKDRIYILINGILDNPQAHKDWNYRGATWIETHTPYKAMAFEYFTDILFFRKFFQAKRVNEVIAVIEEYASAGFEIALVGHSNGCDIIIKLLQKCKIPVLELHLFSAACERNFDLNGLNQAWKTGRIGPVCLYGSQSDGALKKARKASGLLSIFHLEYGTLGLDGPTDNVFPVSCDWRNNFGHSTWWQGEHFEESMKSICHIPMK